MMYIKKNQLRSYNKYFNQPYKNKCKQRKNICNEKVTIIKKKVQALFKNLNLK